MPSRLIIVIVLLSQVACDYRGPTQNDKIKWAVIDTGRVFSSYFETYKTNHPYPPELTTHEDISHRTELLRTQISQRERELRETCDKFRNPNTPAETSTERDTIILPSGDSIIIPKPGSRPTHRPNPSDPSSKEYFECMTNTKYDASLAELQEKMRKLNDSNREIVKFDQDTRKKFDVFIKDTIRQYAEKHGHQVILNNHPDSILYAADKIYLNATDDFLDFLAKKPSPDPAADKQQQSPETR